MKRTAMFRFGIAALMMGLLISFSLTSYGQEVIEIQVSPNVLNLQNQGEVVTVHTEIAYSLVVGGTVTLNGLEIDWWKSDNQGNFVAKFEMTAIQGMPLNIGDYNELVLSGTKTDGSTFTGTDNIMVINVIPQGKK